MDKKSAKEQIEKLVVYFEKNIHQIKTPSFNEAQTRQLLIDPFFEAFGWDVRNKNMEPPYRLEVISEGRVKTILKNNSRHDEDIQYIIEDEFKADHKLATKKPDYRFRIQGQTKFFVEAKKPYIDLSTNLNAIFQIKRYGFSARVPISILTDFDQFRVFDCTRKPFYDKPKTGVLKEFDLNYDSYLDKFDNLYDTFSRDAILAGSLETLQKKYFEKRTGEFSLDRAFLDDLSQWRVELAQDIAKHPKNRRILNTLMLNECVQRILDRIVFLRVCEDRTIEETGTLLALLRLWQDHPAISLYHKFNELIKNRRSLYNGLLFAEHECEQLEVGNKVLENIFKNINYPLSPYNFDEIGVEILGSIYERFLGRTIRMTEKQVRIEEKPEVRKAGGVYYTPQYIVKYIVENTLGKLLYGKHASHSEFISESNSNEEQMLKQVQHDRKLLLSPKQIEKIKIIDIACGSGSFLLGALQMLFDYHIQWYTEHPADVKEKHGVRDAYTDATGLMQLSSRKKREILVNNIYGVDIDPQAVEVTQMSLYLKVLEDENDATLNKPTMLALHEVLLPPLKNNIKCGNSLIGTDIFSQGDLFDNELMRSINPFDWETEFKEIIDNGGFDVVIGNPPWVFGGGVDIEQFEKDYFFNNFDSAKGKVNLFAIFLECAAKVAKKGGYVSYIVPNTLLRVTSYKYIREYLVTKLQLHEICDMASGVFQGVTMSTIIINLKKDKPAENIITIKKGLDKIISLIPQERFFSEGHILNIFATEIDSNIIEKMKSKSIFLGEICRELIFGVVITKNIDEVVFSKPSTGLKRFVEGRDIGRYLTPKNIRYLLYDKELLHRARTPEIFEADEKIMIQRITGGKRPLNATFDNTKLYNKESINNIILKDETQYKSKYILSLINSSLLNWFYRFCFTNESTLTVNLSKEYLSKLPIHTIDFTNPAEKHMHDELVGLVDRMLELNKQLQKIQSDTERETVMRLIAATDNKIDQLVYKLYDLTEEEIRIVEGK